MSRLSPESIAKRVTDALLKIPYAENLGIQPRLLGGEFILVLPFKQSLVGNPVLPALHGGAIGGFMEMAAISQLIIDRAEMGHDETADLPKPIGINIDYLRRGKPVETYARAIVFKAGKRVSNVRVEAWQEDRERPIAALHGHFLTAADNG